MSACKGLHYRLRLSTHITERSVVSTKRFNKVTLLSCKGCDACENIDVILNEDLALDIFPAIDEEKDGALYRLTYVGGPIDPETGYCDNIDLMFKRVKEDTTQ